LGICVPDFPKSRPGKFPEFFCKIFWLREKFWEIFLKSFVEIFFAAGNIFEKKFCAARGIIFTDGSWGSQTIFTEGGGGSWKIFEKGAINGGSHHFFAFGIDQPSPYQNPTNTKSINTD